MAEASWLDAHPEKLQAVAGLWIAIKGTEIRASSDDLEELLDWIADQNLVDALVTRVPEDGPTPRYMLA